ncbi:MAG TPA: hypothetical protein VKN99_25415 [Polyangia bacterium]|nr:hypothetical protein [Polyangia bacterium]
MRLALALSTIFAAACASSGSKSSTPQHVAPPTQTGPVEGEGVGTSSGTPEHDPEVVHTGKSFNLAFQAAHDHYERKGSKCAGADAPDNVIGKPDQRNETQIGHDKLVTYGYRFKEGTLVIRCRNDHVELTKILGTH